MSRLRSTVTRFSITSSLKVGDRGNHPGEVAGALSHPDHLERESGDLAAVGECLHEGAALADQIGGGFQHAPEVAVAYRPRRHRDCARERHPPAEQGPERPRKLGYGVEPQHPSHRREAQDPAVPETAWPFRCATKAAKSRSVPSRPVVTQRSRLFTNSAAASSAVVRGGSSWLKPAKKGTKLGIHPQEEIGSRPEECGEQECGDRPGRRSGWTAPLRPPAWRP